MPKVSVLVPCYNAAPYVRATLESLRSQTFEDWECVVVDDGSTDDSALIVVDQVRRDMRIALVQQANAGVSRARNRAYVESSPQSRYLLFLDSDDCLEPDMLGILVDHLDRNAHVGLVYCGFTWVGKDDEPILPNDPRLPDFLPTRYTLAAGLGLRVLPPDAVDTPFASIFGAWAGLLPSNALLRRSVYAHTPGWDESLGQPSEDTDVFLNMALLASVHYLAVRMVRYRRHAMQSTTDRGRILRQDRKLFEKWSQMPCLTDRERAIVLQARWFRQTRILPYIAVRHGLSHLANGHLAEGTKCVLRAARMFGLSSVQLSLARQSRGTTQRMRAAAG